MSTPIPPQSEDETKPTGGRNGGVDVSGEQVSVGRDIAGRDILTAGRDIVGGDVVTTTTHSGLSAAEVQRLLITVGILVFITAACFFSGGAIVGGATIALLNKPVDSSEQKAQEMAAKLGAMSALASGQGSQLTFTEDQISSYVRFIAGPEIGLNDGKVRLMDEAGRFVVGGKWKGLGNMPVAATFHLSTGDPSLQLESAAVRVLPLGNSAFGWVAVPPQVLQPLVDQLNEKLWSKVSLNWVRESIPVDTSPVGPQLEWTVGVTGR